MGLDTVEFLMFADKKFDIVIKNEKASNVLIMADFAALCQYKRTLKQSISMSKKQIFDMLCEVLRDKFAIKGETKPEHKIVADLRLK